jgi:hypothetical protein
MATQAKAKATGEKLVRYRLPVERDNAGAEYFAINGRNFRIQRGVEVEIPEYVADFIDKWQREREDAYFAKMKVHDEQPDLTTF